MGPNFEPKNVDSRKRERRYLEADERKALLAAAKGSRWAARDYALVLLAYRHGLRCSGGPFQAPATKLSIHPVDTFPKLGNRLRREWTLSDKGSAWTMAAPESKVVL